jgi:hypothetical protein
MGEIDKNTKDFGDHNVFSYVYSTKEHQSKAAGARSEQRINAIKDQFMSPNKNNLSQKFEMQRDHMNKQTEEIL